MADKSHCHERVSKYVLLEQYESYAERSIWLFGVSV
jgi:hypothetical protein